MNPILPTIYEEIPLLVLKDWKEKEEKEKVNSLKKEMCNENPYEYSKCRYSK
jgi:hypothetical protein